MTPTPTVPRRHFLARLFGALVGGAWLGGQGLTSRSEAGGTDTPYLGEIRMFAAEWAPVGWLTCDGSLLPIADYDPLWQVIGTTYGGDGQTTFGLPDLRSRIPLHPGTMQLAQFAGEEAVVLLPFQAPLHSHALQGNTGLGGSDNPAGGVPARNGVGNPHYAPGVNTWFATDALMAAGQSQPHTNLMPSLCINFIICVEGGATPTP